MDRDDQRHGDDGGQTIGLIPTRPVPRRAAPAECGQAVEHLVPALGGAITKPAWKSKPSWYLVATEDRMIPVAAQRSMAERAGSTVTEVAGSHAVYVSKPKDVAALIARAARELTH